MTKAYLNRLEKDQVLTLSSFIDYANATADEWSKSGKYKDCVKSLRMAKSFILRALSIKCEHLDDLECDNLMNQSAKMDVVLKYKNDAIREHKEMLKLDSVTPIQTHDLLDLCEKAMVGCKDCSELQSDCKIKMLFIKYDVPVCDPNPGPYTCPYFNE
jgi:hypothetical protein